MLRDDETDEIERGLQHGWRGPVLLTWLERLLQDRRERRERERRIRELLDEGEGREKRGG